MFDFLDMGRICPVAFPNSPETGMYKSPRAAVEKVTNKGV